jgi:predicted membrane-bound mannosyltransferase
MLEALVTSPFIWAGDCWLVEFQTVTANEDIRLVRDFDRCSIRAVQQAYHTRSELAAFVVAAVVAVRVYRLTFQGFGFFTSRLAGFVAHELHALPVGVRHHGIGAIHWQ